MDKHSCARVTPDCGVAEAGIVRVYAGQAATANTGAKSDHMEEPMDYSTR